MPVSTRFAKVTKVTGMTSRELGAFKDGQFEVNEVPRSEFFRVAIEVIVEHDGMDDNDIPASYEAVVRLPILSCEEPFDEIELRAREQLRKDALALAEHLAKTEKGS